MEPSTLGGSILVPSVRELAKECTAGTVPARYLRPDQDPPPAVTARLSSPSIPIIDMEKLVESDSSPAELQRLHTACKDWGFFQVVNHGVSSLVVERMKSETGDFFSLPLEEKKKLWQNSDDLEGFGQLFVVSEEQILDWADMFYLTLHPPSMRKPRLFHHLPPTFRETMEAYWLETRRLGLILMRFMGEALGLKGNEMEDVFGDGFGSMRLNYYPPCPRPESVAGLSPHSDASGITILLQANEVEGLQIKKDGHWISIHPLPNAFTVNVGDVMEIVSNGVYRSIEHRAMVNSSMERLSIAAFQSPKMTAMIGPALSLTSYPENPALFRTMPAEKYYRDFFSRKLLGKSHVDYMRINHQEGNTNNVTG